MGGRFQQEQESPVDAERSEQDIENEKHARVSSGQPAVEEQEPEDDEEYNPYRR